MERGLIFANADHVQQRIRSLVKEQSATTVLDAETMPVVDVTAAQMLVDLGKELAAKGTTLLLARDVGQVRDILRRAGADTLLTKVYRSVDAAVDAVHNEETP